MRHNNLLKRLHLVYRDNVTLAAWVRNRTSTGPRRLSCPGWSGSPNSGEEERAMTASRRCPQRGRGPVLTDTSGTVPGKFERTGKFSGEHGHDLWHSKSTVRAFMRAGRGTAAASGNRPSRSRQSLVPRGAADCGRRCRPLAPASRGRRAGTGRRAAARGCRPDMSSELLGGIDE